MARISRWEAKLPDGTSIAMGSGRTVEEFRGPYQLDVQTDEGRRVVLDVLPEERAHVFTRVMRRRDGSELTVPVVELQGVRLYLHPDGDVVTTDKELYW